MLRRLSDQAISSSTQSRFKNKNQEPGSRSSVALLPGMALPEVLAPALEGKMCMDRTIGFPSQSFTSKGSEAFLSPIYLVYGLLVSFTGSNLLAIKDEAENAFLLEELLAFGSSVQTVWLNAHFDNNSKCCGCRGGADKYAQS